MGTGFQYPDLGVDLLRLTLRCRDIDKHLSARVGLTIDEVHCLGVIHSENPSCAKQLTELLHVDATRTSKILRSLERRGLVSRTLSVADHRKEQVILTDEGRRIIERILSLYAQLGSRVFDAWPPEVIADLPRLLQELEHEV